MIWWRASKPTTRAFKRCLAFQSFRRKLVKQNGGRLKKSHLSNRHTCANVIKRCKIPESTTVDSSQLFKCMT